MRVLRSFAPFTMIVLMAVLVSADTGATARPTFRLTVVPFERDGGVPEDWRFSFALPAALAEKFERIASDSGVQAAMKDDAFAFSYAEWPLVLPDETPRIVPDGKSVDLQAAADAARKRGATHMLTGRYEGSVEKWRLTVEIYELKGLAPALVASASRDGSIFNLKTRVVDMIPLQGMLASATAEALEKAGVRLPDPAKGDLATPATRNSWAFILLGRAYARHFWPKDQGKHRTAVEMADNAVDVDPKYVEARRFHAWLVWANGKTDKSAKLAVESYVEAIKRRPDDVRSLLGAGELTTRSGDYDLAIGWLERALKQRPDSPAANRWLGVAYAGKGRMKEAFARLERARDLDPADLAIRRALKDLYARERRYADAATELRAIVTADPSDAVAPFELAACLRAVGKLDEAVDAYAAAEARFPKDARLPKFRGDALLESGRAAEADEAYAAARKLAPKDPRLVRKGESVLGGSALVEELDSAMTLRRELDAANDAFQGAANDAELELWIRARWPKAKKGAEPVADPRHDELCRNASSSKGEAIRQADAYGTTAGRYRASVLRLASSLRGGEGAALTPDRLADAERLVDEAEREARVSVEIGRTLASSIPWLERSAKCPEGEVASDDPASIVARNALRVVPAEEYVPGASSAIMPSIPAGASRIVRFRVDNAAGPRDLSFVMLDGRGKPMTDPWAVPAGRSLRFSIRAGYYRYCLLPTDLAATCGERGTVRSNYLYEGVLITFY